MDKTFYLLDTFGGLVKTLYSKEEIAINKESDFKNAYESCYHQVLKTFSMYKNVKIIKGVVPDTLTQVNSNKISFLSIDLNSVVP